MHYVPAALILRLMVGYIALVLVGRASFCPPKWKYYQPSKTCLRPLLEKLNYVNYWDAEKLCDMETEHSRLIQSAIVTVEDKEMLKFIQSDVVNTGQYYSWIGLKDTEEGWTYLNGEKATFLNGGILESSDFKLYRGIKRCVRLQNMTYAIRECKETGGYPLCELTPEIVADLCLTQNGGCSHECVSYAYKKRVCTCPVGFVILEGKTTCRRIGINSCSPDNGGCDHFCEEVEASAVICSCKLGYMLLDMKQCVDVDECVDGFNGGCQHNCINEEGSRNCTCAAGFFAVNGTNCTIDPDLVNLPLMNMDSILKQVSEPGGNSKSDNAQNYDQHSLIITLYILSSLAGILVLAKLMQSCKKYYQNRKEGTEQIEHEFEGWREEAELNGIGAVL